MFGALLGSGRSTDAPVCESTLMRTRVIFSIPIYECPDCAKRQYTNVLALNQDAAIVSHINEKQPFGENKQLFRENRKLL